jgi:hypothetical protein
MMNRGGRGWEPPLSIDGWRPAMPIFGVDVTGVDPNALLAAVRERMAPDIVDLVEIKGVWMIPEDAVRS